MTQSFKLECCCPRTLSNVNDRVISENTLSLEKNPELILIG